MNQEANRYGGDLKPVMVLFFLSAALLLMVAIGAVTQMRSRLLLEKTFESLTRAKSGLVRVREANENRKQALKALQSLFGQDSKSHSPEIILYGKMDEVKSRTNPDDMTLSAVDKAGGEASLQYTLTFSNPEYNTLLNTINYLHNAVFPLTTVGSVSVAQADLKGTGGLSYKISGKVITVEKPKQ